MWRLRKKEDNTRIRGRKLGAVFPAVLHTTAAVHHRYRRTGRDAEKSTRYVSLMTNLRTHTSIRGHLYHSTNVPDA